MMNQALLRQMDRNQSLKKVPIIDCVYVETDINEYVKKINEYVLKVNVNVNQENTVDALVTVLVSSVCILEVVENDFIFDVILLEHITFVTLICPSVLLLITNAFLSMTD